MTNKYMDIRLKIDHIEEILIHMGLIRPSKDNDFEDKLEFMKLWQQLNQIQRDNDAKQQAEAAARNDRERPFGDYVLDISKQSESNSKINDGYSRDGYG